MADKGKYIFRKLIKYLNSTTAASFVTALEIVRLGKLFTVGQYTNKQTNHSLKYHGMYFQTSKSKLKVEIRVTSLSAKTVEESIIKTATNEDIKLAQAYSIESEM